MSTKAQFFFSKGQGSLRVLVLVVHADFFDQIILPGQNKGQVRVNSMKSIVGMRKYICEEIFKKGGRYTIEKFKSTLALVQLCLCLI